VTPADSMAVSRGSDTCHMLMRRSGASELDRGTWQMYSKRGNCRVNRAVRDPGLMPVTWVGDQIAGTALAIDQGGAHWSGSIGVALRQRRGGHQLTGTPTRRRRRHREAAERRPYVICRVADKSSAMVDAAGRRRVDFAPACRSPALIWLIGGVLRMKMNHLLFRPTIAPIGAVYSGRSVPISS